MMNPEPDLRTPDGKPERAAKGLALAMMVAVYGTFIYTIVEATLLS